MARYEATRFENGVIAKVDGQPLDKRTDLFNHSPQGFEFGYGGSGPAQLALAILAHHFRSRLKDPGSATRATADERAVRYHQDFKNLVISRVEGDHFSITTEGIEETLERIDKRKAEDRRA
jgi:hypothetical protein